MALDTPENTRESLPFEPKGKKAKAPKVPATATATASSSRSSAAERRRNLSLEETRIPDVVSKRMVRRIIGFSGLPSGLGILVFFASYWVVSNDLFTLPTSAVVLASMGCFGLGVLGLSYGVLSASWEEAEEGSALGLAEFRTNAGRMITAWREGRAKS